VNNPRAMIQGIGIQPSVACKYIRFMHSQSLRCSQPPQLLRLPSPLGCAVGTACAPAAVPPPQCGHGPGSAASPHPRSAQTAAPASGTHRLRAPAGSNSQTDVDSSSTHRRLSRAANGLAGYSMSDGWHQPCSMCTATGPSCCASCCVINPARCCCRHCCLP
jgi:hypothetical protein